MYTSAATLCGHFPGCVTYDTVSVALSTRAETSAYQQSARSLSAANGCPQLSSGDQVQLDLVDHHHKQVWRDRWVCLSPSIGLVLRTRLQRQEHPAALCLAFSSRAASSIQLPRLIFWPDSLPPEELTTDSYHDYIKIFDVPSGANLFLTTPSSFLT